MQGERKDGLNVLQFMAAATILLRTWYSAMFEGVGENDWLMNYFEP